MNKAIFLDRDGVINKERDDEIDHIDKISILPGVEEAIKLFHDVGFLIFIVTNQPIVARGIITEKQLEKIHQHLVSLLQKKGGKITKVYFCPHHPKAIVAKYRKICECRKPSPGMLLQAAKEFSVNLKQSFMIGDMPSDIALGKNAGCTAFMITSSHNEKIIETGKPFEIHQPVHRFDTLLEAARFITQHH